MKIIRKISENGIKRLIQEEGVVLRAYLDQVKVATIGIGSTFWENGTRVKMTDKPITRERAIRLFHYTLESYVSAVNNAITVQLTQNQFDALVSLCYNIGTSGFSGSTLVRKINLKADSLTIQKWFLVWCNAGGKPILLPRRKREFSLYSSINLSK